MDSIDLCNQNDFEAIKEALTTGAITIAEMDRRLHALLDYETSKPTNEIDANIVSACTDLLWELHAQEMAQIPNRKDEQWAGIEHSLKKSDMRSKRIHSTFRIAFAVTALFVLLILGENVLYRQWLQGSQSPDEQQLILEGKVVDPGLVEHGNAGHTTDVRELASSNLQEIETFLGYAPPCPQVIPSGWKLIEYKAVRKPDSTSFYATYCFDANPENLSFIFDRYAKAEYAREEVEQNQQGTVDQLNSGQKVYIAENMDQSVCLWEDGLDVYIITGPIEKDSLLQMAESIM